MRPLSIVIVAVTLLCLAGSSAFAHPHVFVSWAVTAQIGEHGPTALKLSWTFDEMYSALVINDNVSDPSGPLSEEDVQRVHDHAFANTANYHYFLDVWLNRQLIKIDEVTDFKAALHDHRLTYEFTVPLAKPEARGLSELVVVVFDQEYYVEFSLAKTHPVTVEASDGLGAKCITYTDQNQPSELGPVSRDVVRCTWKHRE